MIRCPNCGRRTSGDYCQWCKYPVLRGKSTHIGSQGQAKTQAVQSAKEQAKREAEAAKQAQLAEKQAKIQAELAAKEQAKKEAEAVKKQ
ncbi:MAG: hypothetical protein PHN78_02510, partial [Dehalococcoidales bacterium]|nr:hypothetical protein [Dehalococcoidales bacterium]